MHTFERFIDYFLYRAIYLFRCLDLAVINFSLNFYCFLQCRRLDGGLSKLLSASEQLAELNEKLAVQKIAVTEKTESCELLLSEISARTGIATEKKQLALAKKKEIAEQNIQIVKEKVLFSIIFIISLMQ